MRINLDTNILLRNANPADPDHLRVRDALQRLTRNGWELCIGVQNVVEFWVVATRPTNVNGLGLSPAAALAEVGILLSTYRLLRDTIGLFERWLDLCSRYAVSGKPAHDARILALMLEHGLTHLLTLNVADFARYNEITALLPDDV